jgi:hypothetical protein
MSERSRKPELPIEAFDPVKAALLGAVDSIDPDLRGKTHKFRSDVTGESYLVASFEKPMSASDLQFHKDKERHAEEAERLRAATPYKSAYPGRTRGALEKIADAARSRLRPQYSGVIAVALLGASNAETSVFYESRRRDRGDIYSVTTAESAITDPEEFARIVSAADFSQPVDVLTGASPAELRELAREHAPLMREAEALLARDGLSRFGNSPVIIPTRSARYTRGDEQISIFKNLEQPDSLHIMWQHSNVDGDTILESYARTSHGEESYLGLLSIEIGDRKIPSEPYSITNAMSPETAAHIYDIFNTL